ncbi:BgTH12-05329 [Blumeria graminis f. sp. triticale]|uniref:BgTH12-05329 n=1 Tax=Blumeria graminis f. sp. triticale TaxID=1689686 RepID=A0A9W4DJ69_BLUGR|nr:BgTH12-05329 [Blumeria graminis f. sp. triticale]
MRSYLIFPAWAMLAAAHFTLEYPESRGFDEDTLDKFPCGGQNDISEIRTPYPLSNGVIALKMGHIKSRVQVTIALDSDPTTAFNTVLRPTFQETGLGKFCMTGISIPTSLNVQEGMNATIQVLTSGDDDGGLYNCADIVFSAAAPVPVTDDCQNATSIKASGFMPGNANESMSANDGSKGDKDDDDKGDKKSGAFQIQKIGFGGSTVIGLATLITIFL